MQRGAKEMKLKGILENAIKETENKFIKSPGIFLSESDMRCHLFNSLYKNVGLSKEKKSKDGKTSIDLHTEIRWYGNGSRRLLSDIVVVDAKDLVTTESATLKLPSKGYRFNLFHAIIELKLRRGRSDKRLLDEIKRDINKIKIVRDEVQESFLSYIIVFDKKKNIENLMPNQTGIKIIYAYSG